MSFFVRGGASDSESEDSSEESLLSDSGSDAGLQQKGGKAKKGSDDSSDSDSDSDDSDAGARPSAAEAAPAAPRVSRFARGGPDDSDSDSDDDERGRIVRSARSKRLDELDGGAKRVENALRIDDWSTVSNEFDKLAKLVAANPGGGVALTAEMATPPVWLKTVVSLDEALANPDIKKKKLNAIHNRALNTMRQKIKRFTRENEALVQRFKSVRGRCRAASCCACLELRGCAACFGATDPPAQDPEAYERGWEAAMAPAPAAGPKPAKQRAADAAAGEGGDDADFETVGRGGKTLNLTAEGVFKTLVTVLEARGKKSTDRLEQTRILEKLLALASTPYARIRVALALANSMFDYNQAAHAYMPLDLWTTAREKIDSLLDLLDEEPAYIVQEHVADYDEMVERTPEESEDKVVRIRGSVLSMIERLDDEFTRSLREIDPHAIEYVQRLKDERPLYRLLVRSQSYLERIDQGEHVERVVMRRLDHVYSKVRPCEPRSI